ncbi:MAG: SPASM domain-containing protein [Spirochaetales bacterium]|nr:SPASM domain-containing protein [Spirochaetales bacterium]
MNPVIHLSLFITENCNLQCDYCFASGMQKRDISPPTATRAIDFLFGHAGKEPYLHISFWGGEPLLRFDLIQNLVLYAESKAEASGKAISFSIPTNATLLSAETIHFIKDHGISLSLSIDGTDESQRFRKTLTGKSSFSHVERTLSLLKKTGNGSNCSIRKTVFPKNAGLLARDVAYFLAHGFRYLAFSPVMETSWTERSYDIFLNEQLACADMWIDALKKSDPFFVQSWTDILLLGKLSAGKSVHPSSSFFCGAGAAMIAVDIDGDIFPCHRFVFYDKENRREKLGSVESGFSEHVRSRYINVKQPAASPHHTRCSRCGVRNMCSLLCPATNYSLTGDIAVPGPALCRFVSMTEKVIEAIEDAVGTTPVYKDYIDNLMRATFPGYSRSRFGKLFWDRVLTADIERLAGKTADGLKQLKLLKQDKKRRRS